MMKTCVVLKEQVINVGEWDDQGGSNPLPEGATVEERDFEYSEEYGWSEVGFVPEPSEMELLKEKTAVLDTVIEELIFIIIPEITGGRI